MFTSEPEPSVQLLVWALSGDPMKVLDESLRLGGGFRTRELVTKSLAKFDELSDGYSGKEAALIEKSGLVDQLRETA